MHFERYNHHGTLVAVQFRLRGRHKEHCLCFQKCKFFAPDEPDNCPIAQQVYDLCVREDLVLPVWECPMFEQEPE